MLTAASYHDQFPHDEVFKNGDLDIHHFCERYYGRFHAQLGLMQNKRDSKRLRDMMYAHFRDYYTAVFDARSKQGGDIDATIEEVAVLCSAWLPPH